VGATTKEVNGYKQWYSGSNKARNVVDILFDKELVDFIVGARRKSGRIMTIKVLVGSEMLNVVSVYAPQIGFLDDIKKQFWDDLDIVIQDAPRSKKNFP